VQSKTYITNDQQVLLLHSTVGGWALGAHRRCSTRWPPAAAAPGLPRGWAQVLQAPSHASAPAQVPAPGGGGEAGLLEVVHLLSGRLLARFGQQQGSREAAALQGASYLLYDEARSLLLVGDERGVVHTWGLGGGAGAAGEQALGVPPSSRGART
jgi:hypothetical protein